MKFELFNSNPASIMTDPDIANKKYRTIDSRNCFSDNFKRETDAILPQWVVNCFNLAVKLSESDFKKNNVELIGADLTIIKLRIEDCLKIMEK